MKNKRCVLCNKLICKKDWLKITLTPTEKAWQIKKYCCDYCKGRANTLRYRKRRDAQRNTGD